jgi:trehalose 6-phosphate synthase/phosphatase
MPAGGSKLIIVSNRLPVQLIERHGKVTIRVSDGGLVSSLKSYFEKSSVRHPFTEKVWIGAADFPEVRWNRYSSKATEAGFALEPIFIPQKEYSQYYNSFCNSTLWPLFHYFPSYAEFSASPFKSYEQVNQLFCQRILDVAKPGDTVWIHDYQLMLLPGMVRQQISTLSIGFFLHIPFPSYELFRLLHKEWKEKIVEGLLGADLIGFHTHEYLQHFLDVIRRMNGIAHQMRQITWRNRRIQTGVFPISIDFEKFNTASVSQSLQKERAFLQGKFKSVKIIFSVDRLDYTKGITHRLSGFERFLDQFRSWHEKVIFVLVVVPSRQAITKYDERKKMIEQQVSRINGKYSTLQWQPILYRYRTLKFPELSFLYQTADVALITPLRDGMNLVAKEYVASRKHKDGVLILSELAGAAHELNEALLVNPADSHDVAKSIETALVMGVAEQKIRIGRMQDLLKSNNVVAWVSSFIAELQRANEWSQNHSPHFVTDEAKSELKSNLQASGKRLIMLDYDGTLVKFTDNPDQAKPSRDLLEFLERLTRYPGNHVAIISGRKFETLNRWLNDVNAYLVAEHGSTIKIPDSGETTVLPSLPVNLDIVRSTLNTFAERCKGSFVEEKGNSMAWHYRSADEVVGFRQSRELLDCLLHLLNNTAYHVIDGNKVVEVRPAAINKGTAVEGLRQLIQPDTILAIGDDATDEDMFAALPDNGITIKVGTGETKARFRLPGQEDVLPFLKHILSWNK